MTDNSTLGVNATCLLGVALVAGVVLRKLGTIVSNEENIRKMERLLYGDKVKEE